jgi:hypothetical protein
MSKFTAAVFRRKSRPNEFAVSPDLTGVVLPNPSDWEHDSSIEIDPEAARAVPGAEVHKWIIAFQQTGYCLLSEKPDTE